jgi:hypothetical protein
MFRIVSVMLIYNRHKHRVTGPLDVLMVPSVTFPCNFQGVRRFFCDMDSQSLHAGLEHRLPVNVRYVEVK